MKKINSKLLLVFVLVFTTSVSAQNWWKNKVKGNGNVSKVTRTTGDYDAVRCAGFMDFELVDGKEGKITIEGEENLLDYIITEVKNDELVVKVEKGVNLKTSWKKGIKITIPADDIEKVSLSGSGDVYNNFVLDSDDLKVELSGSGDMNLKVKTNYLSSAITGSGDIKIVGDTDVLETKITGSGDFHGFELNANNTEAYVTGSGDIKVFSNKMLKARVTGSGDITYKGDPDKEDTKVTGSGSIRK
jgi:hypothetical protein